MGLAESKLKKIQVKSGSALSAHPDFLHYQTQNTRSTLFVQKLEQFIYRHRNKLVLVHVAMFLFFLALIGIPVFLPQPAEDSSIFTNFTLFAQFLIWGIWFPLVFASVIFSGRSWCGILCPMGAASEWATRFGLQRKIPGWLKWDGTPILSFILVTILAQTVDARDQALAMAEIFGGTLLLALLIGFFYGKNKKRAWCRHVCPIGLLLGVFSRLGIVQFAKKLMYTLPNKVDQYTEKGICPTMIAINSKQESRHCIQCFRCVKPQSAGGLYVRVRRLGDEIIHIREHSPTLSEVVFIFLATGVSLGGFLWLILPQYQTIRQAIGEWFIRHEWFWIGESGPSWLMSVHPELRQVYNWLDFFTIVGFMVVCMLVVSLILSLCTLLSSYLVARFSCDHSQSLKIRFTELAYQFAPVAMCSIILGLGEGLFTGFHHLGVSAFIISAIKGSLLCASMLWSIYLGERLIARQGVAGIYRYIALLPAAMGSLIMGIVWSPAILGFNFSLLEQYRQNLVVLG